MDQFLHIERTKRARKYLLLTNVHKWVAICIVKRLKEFKFINMALISFIPQIRKFGIS